MNDRTRIINSLRESFFTKLASLDNSNSPLDNTKLVNFILEILKSNSYQRKVDYFPSFLISVHPDNKQEGDFILTEAYFDQIETKINLNEFNVIEVNNRGYKIKEEKFNDYRVISLDEVNDISISNTEIKFFFIQGNSLNIFYKGRFIKNIPNIHFEKDYRGYNNKLSINDVSIILDRYKEYFPREIKPSIYWKNKSSRILKSKPELLLAFFFQQFLDNIVADGTVDGECLNGTTDNRLDIRVVHHHTNEIFIFEVKWIGKSEGINYINKQAHVRANEGIEQIKVYLNEDSLCKSGVLVLYDARDKSDEIKWTEKDKWDKKIYDPPFVLYLESRSASVLAKESVNKKDKKD